MIMQHTIIDSELKYGIKYIENIKNYNMIISDSIDKLKAVRDVNSDYIVLFTNKKEDIDIKFMYINKSIECIKLKGLYMYIISNNTINSMPIVEKVSKKHLNLETAPFDIHTVDSRYLFLISKLLSRFSNTNVNILDICTVEDSSLSLIKWHYIHNNINITRISKFIYKTKTTCRIYNQKTLNIEIY